MGLALGTALAAEGYGAPRVRRHVVAASFTSRRSRAPACDGASRARAEDGVQLTWDCVACRSAGASVARSSPRAARSNPTPIRTPPAPSSGPRRSAMTAPLRLLIHPTDSKAVSCRRSERVPLARRDERAGVAAHDASAPADLQFELSSERQHQLGRHHGATPGRPSRPGAGSLPRTGVPAPETRTEGHAAPLTANPLHPPPGNSRGSGPARARASSARPCHPRAPPSSRRTRGRARRRGRPRHSAA